MAGRTVTSVTDRHRLFKGIESTSVTDRHRLFKGIESLNYVTEQQDGPSQARRTVTDCVIPGWVGFL